MSALPADPSATPPTEPATSRPRRLRVPRPRVPRPRMRQEGGMCGNCGFDDTGHYCSRCGEPLHGTEESVMEILWADLVEGPLHNLFALGKTTWLMLVHPHRFFHGVLRRQRGLAGFPFFLAPAWSRVSHKPHGVPNAVKYFVLIYTLVIVCAWAFGVNPFPTIPLPEFIGGGGPLPGAFTEPLFLIFVVFAAWMYAAAVSRLLGGRIETDVLTKFMLYLNGFALIPFVGMAVAGVRHRWVFFGCMVFWLYVLFLLPHVVLPRLFGVSRGRLSLAQGGAALANLLMVVAMVFGAGMAASYFGLIEPVEGVAASATAPFDPAGGFEAWKRVAEKAGGALPEPLRSPLSLVERGATPQGPASGRRRTPGNPSSAETLLFPKDTLDSPLDVTTRGALAVPEKPARRRR